MRTPKDSFAALIAAMERMDRNHEKMLELTPEGDEATVQYDLGASDALKAYRELRAASEVLDDILGLLGVTYRVPE